MEENTPISLDNPPLKRRKKAGGESFGLDFEDDFWEDPFDNIGMNPKMNGTTDNFLEYQQIDLQLPNGLPTYNVNTSSVSNMPQPSPSSMFSSCLVARM